MGRARHSIATIAVVLGIALAATTACSGDDADDGAAAPGDTPASTTAPACPSEAQPLEVVLVNDDGVINPAIDTLVDALDDVSGIELTIVAPAEERSGSSDSTTPGGAPFEEASTPGGQPAYAVDGYPADAVAVALDDLGLDPDLFLSGVNPGQNFGPASAISGTVGVGRTAIRRGYPALAVSAGLTFDQAQFDFAAGLARDWIDGACESLVSGTHQTDTVTSINVPACPPEQMGPLQEVETAAAFPELPEGQNVFASSCDQSNPAPVTDVDALIAGYPAITQVPADLPTT